MDSIEIEILNLCKHIIIMESYSFLPGSINISNLIIKNHEI